MRRTQFPVILAGILVVGWAGWGILGLVLAALGSFTAYRVSLHRNPRMRHGKCNGSGEVRGKVFTWTFHKCKSPHCGGGRIIRRGAGWWGSQPVRAERARLVTGKKRSAANKAWR